LRSDDSVELLSTTGLPVGLFARAAYEEGKVLLERGDLLLLYSDGVSEANNAAEEEFGVDRMVEVLRAYRDEPASVVVEQMVRRIDEFAGAAPQFDDITLMALKRVE